MESTSGLYRAGRVPQRVIYALLFTLVVVVMVLLLPKSANPSYKYNSGISLRQETPLVEYYTYNSTFPLSNPIRTRGSVKYKIGIVADQDEKSKADGETNTWYSILKTGELTYRSNSVTVEWTEEHKLSTRLSEKGRGAELSELVVFDGKLLTVDDRSGIVFHVKDNSEIIPWVKLNDGPGDVGKGFKGEWMAVKNNHLYIGGLGKEWTSPSGEFINEYPQYVKRVSPLGHVEDIPWVDKYKAMKKAAGIEPSGYIIHESACWSDFHKKWFFLPRRASHQIYNDVDDEHRATNIMITADEDFGKIETKKITKWNMSRGFSSFKFLPGTNDQVVVALKSQENRGDIATCETHAQTHTHTHTYTLRQHLITPLPSHTHTLPQSHTHTLKNMHTHTYTLRHTLKNMHTYV